jgi:hypothetical protein
MLVIDEFGNAEARGANVVPSAECPEEPILASAPYRALRWQGGKVSVTDGPYAETKEQTGGCWCPGPAISTTRPS